MSEEEVLVGTTGNGKDKSCLKGPNRWCQEEI